MVRRVGLTTLLVAAWFASAEVRAQSRPSPTTADAPPQQADRGPGVPTSMFGTYVRQGEWLVYPFFEHYRANAFEYKPAELGYPGDADYRGRFRANEALVFVGYGLTPDLSVEFEMARIRATLDRAVADTSGVPQRIAESGLGDVEGQIRWRWRRETADRPEFFSYAEAVVPHARRKVLIGTSGWEFKAGTGMVRGFGWGTMTVRGAVEYAAASGSPWDIGEYAVEYLKRLSPHWRVYVGVEGTQDEVALITEAQWHVWRRAFVRINSGWGLTSKAADWAPEIGMVWSFPTRRTPQ
jgi:hypothetical protein